MDQENGGFDCFGLKQIEIKFIHLTTFLVLEEHEMICYWLWQMKIRLLKIKLCYGTHKILLLVQTLHQHKVLIFL